MSRNRRRAERSGRAAEILAALYLMAKGYRILGRRLRTPYGEVDLAAWKNRALIIIEVKWRKSADTGIEAVVRPQQVRIMRAAETLAGRWRLQKSPMRFDILVLGFGFWPKHVRGAFGLDTPY